jgi:hypothetical protein
MLDFKRHLVIGLTLFAVSFTAHASTLRFEPGHSYRYTGSSGLPVIGSSLDWAIFTESGLNFIDSDLSEGRISLLQATVTPSPGNASGIPFLSAEYYSGVRLTNTGSSAISFAAGAFSLNYSAGYQLFLGDPDPATPPNSSRARLNSDIFFQLLVPGQVQLSRITHDVQLTASGYSENLDPFVRGGITIVVHEASTNGLRFTASSGAFTLLPNEAFQINSSFLVSGAVDGFSDGQVIYDASQTARLSALLPAGVTVDSSVSLPWVSVVPEPGSWATLALGLAILGWRFKQLRAL